LSWLVGASDPTNPIRSRATDTLLLGILIFFVVALIAAVVVLYLKLRKPQSVADISTPLQNLTQVVQSGQTQTAVLAEKISHLEPVTQIVGGVQLELKGLSERVAKVEQNQNAVGQNIQALGTGLAQASTATSSLIEATAAMRNELARAKDGLTELQTFAKARQEIEQRTAESIKRLEMVIAGTQTKGVAGENILEFVFAKLPAEWQVRNFRVGNKSVEFGLRLPNNLILPIDSKWAATNLIEQLVNCDNPDEQQKLKAQIESAVLSKAKEVKKYIDPSLTVNFGIAAVPDAVYDACCGIQADVFQMNVVLVSYSMFVPYLLLVFQMVLKTSQNIDLEKLADYTKTAQENIKKLQEELEGRFPKAITMLNNSRGDMSTYLSKVSSSLTSLQSGANVLEAPVMLPEPGSAGEQGPLP
jgi:DNA recombination protein RmuC